jgi:hypothetical protein
VNVRTSWLWLCVAVLLGVAAVAGAQPPVPLGSGIYPFPGALPGPASAVSAGLGLSDRWLGEEPFDNPAATPARGIMVAPVFQRVKRQDLPADYDYDEIEGYLDLAGGWLSLPVRGVGVTLYAYQPVLRLEDATLTTREDPDLTLLPRVFAATGSARELRAGLALSHAWRGAQLGAAVEWTRRDDSYDFNEIQGTPLPGLSHLDFSGDGIGFQVGARVPVAPAVELGGALRYVPSLDLSGQQTIEALDLEQPVSASREAGWDGGVSARWSASDAFRVLASLGGRTAQAWDGFGVSAGRAVSWSAGLEYAEPEQPWAFRLGLGQEQQVGTPEPRAAVFAVGLGWKADELRLDLGVLRRSFERAGKATSYDDRVVASVTVGF